MSRKNITLVHKSHSLELSQDRVSSHTNALYRSISSCLPISVMSTMSTQHQLGEWGNHCFYLLRFIPARCPPGKSNWLDVPGWTSSWYKSCYRITCFPRGLVLLMPFDTFIKHLPTKSHLFCPIVSKHHKRLSLPACEPGQSLVHHLVRLWIFACMAMYGQLCMVIISIAPPSGWRANYNRTSP